MKIELSRHTFEKSSNIKFREKFSSGSRGVSCEQTDRYDEANSLFRNFAHAPKTV